MSEHEYTDADAPPDDAGFDELPWNMEAEQYTLGAMMLDRTVIDDVMDTIRPGDFYQPKHTEVAKAIGALHRRGAPVDALTVSDELAKAGLTDRAGGVGYTHELVSMVTTASNAEYYASIVRGLAGKRRLAIAAIRIGSIARASEGDVDDLVDSARAELETVAEGRRRKVSAVGESMADLVDYLEQPPTFYRTPWEALDKVIGGFAPGNFTVVAARPGQGKSIVALQVAARLAHEGVVAFCSLEMTERELQLRLVAQYGPVHMSRLRGHKLDSEEWKRVAEARTALDGAPIFVDDTPAVTMNQIRAHARAVSRRGKLAGIVIDYLQLVAGEGDSRREQIEAVSREAKRMAKEFECPVIALAQLRRANSRKGLPTMEDIREAGGIEQDADVILLLHRDKDRKPNDLVVIVEKNRHGDQGRFTLQWQAEFARLLDKTWTPTSLLSEELD